MICRDHDTFLSFLEPAPAYYGDDTQVFAKKILRVVEAIMGSRQGGNLQVNLLPELVAGDSLGPPRQS